jgi:hypothetical protein
MVSTHLLLLVCWVPWSILTSNISCHLGKGLVDLSEKAFEEYFQISVENPLIGVSSRIELMRSVGRSLLAQPDMAGSTGRPGNIVGEH